MEAIFFSGWDGLLRTLVVGVLAYVVLVGFLRLSGKRTLSKMNAFDLVVTVALGSTLATILLSKDVALAEGALAFALLIGLQFVVTWSSVRARWIRRWVTGEPRMLLYRGECLPAALRSARVTQDEVLAAVRAAGLLALEDAEAVVLETDGSFSVVRRRDGAQASSLAGMRAPIG
ncbi:MAG TPA: YetF domain-containing protein [Burkholderiales bacterium]|nr:YetF domain-containing protein [Burkholderiales bacterium]